MTDVSTEIERNFLAREIPQEIAGVKPERLVDIYFPEDSRATMRLRNRDNQYEFTKKTQTTPGDASIHLEQTIQLTKTEFEALQRASQRIVEKDRYRVTIDGYPAEVDIFRGDLAGLVMIDFEFPSEAAKQQFHPPACCLADVTQELFAASGELAGKRYADIIDKLERFAYQRLGD